MNTDDLIVEEVSMNTSTRLLIERRTALPGWEIVAYPKDNEAEAMALLSIMKIEEKKKRYKRDLRLVRKTTEVLSS